MAENIGKDSCHLIEHGISFECVVSKDNKTYAVPAVRNCCQALAQDGTEALLMSGFDTDKPLEWDELFKIKRDLRNNLENARQTECLGCYSFGDCKSDNEDYISFINFDHWHQCNSKCIYCHVHKIKGNSSYKIYQSMVDLVNKGLFRNHGEVTFQGGEPTILSEFEDLINLFLDQKTRIRVHSSGILCNEAIKRGLKEGLLTVVISIDAGDSDTYEKIKQVPKYNDVVNTIKKYSQILTSENKHLLKIKYIIIPGVNDTIKHIDDWFDMLVKNDVKYIIYDIEASYQRTCEKASTHIYMLSDYIKYKAKKLGMDCLMYDSAIYLDQQRKNEPQNILINCKSLFSLVFKLYRNLNKKMNLKYYN